MQVKTLKEKKILCTHPGVPMANNRAISSFTLSWKISFCSELKSHSIFTFTCRSTSKICKTCATLLGDHTHPFWQASLQISKTLCFNHCLCKKKAERCLAPFFTASVKVLVGVTPLQKIWFWPQDNSFRTSCFLRQQFVYYFWQIVSLVCY